MQTAEQEMKFTLAITLLPSLASAFVPQRLVGNTFKTLNQNSRTRPILHDQIIEPWDDAKGVPVIPKIDIGKAIFIANEENNVELTQSDIIQQTIQEESFVNLQEAPCMAIDLGELLKTQEMVDDAKLVLELSSDAVQALAMPNPNQLIIPEMTLESTTSNSSLNSIEGAGVSDLRRAAEVITAPSVLKIIKFAVPAIGVWLCNPLLSLIDTSVVGLLSGVTQQAALNPATAVTDYTALLSAFLYTGSTNLIAAARTKGDGRTQKTLIGALQLSVYVGATLSAFLLAFAEPLLRAIIGNDGISPAVFDAAMRYVRIRSLGLPAAALIGSAQASCLGMQDIRSPLYVLLAAAAVNFAGDMIFVGNSNLWIGGAAGAAWATVFSQYAAAGLFMYWLCSKANDQGKSPHQSSAIINSKLAEAKINGDDQTTISSKGRFITALRSVRNRTASKKTAGQEYFSVRGFLENKLRKRDLLKIPPRSTFKEFLPYFVPVTSTQIGRVSGYVAMSHVVSSSLGTFSMAAQQVIVSLFYSLCPIADSLSLTAQSFLPSIADKEISRERAAALNETVWNFLKAGIAFGAVLVGAVGSLPVLSRFFTPDKVVSSLVNSVTPLLIGFFSIHGLMCAAEGLLLGQKDLSFLGNMYAAFFFIMPYFMLKVKTAALAGMPVGLTSVWTVFLCYQIFRVAAWIGRVAWLQKRTNQEAANLPAGISI